MTTPVYTLITGAGGGFGKALALECASRNMNLVLVDLPGTSLMNLAGYIERNFGVSVLALEYDLTNPSNYPRVFAEIEKQGLLVHILINNAGIGGTHFFTEKGIDYYDRQIRLNVTAPTLLSYLFIRHLGDRHPAFILNVCSLAGFFHLPRKQVYGGTKSYLLAFSNSLRKELAAKNIHVCAVCPGGMNTSPQQCMLNRSGSRIGRWSTMNPEDVATIAITQLLKRKSIVIPGAWNRAFFLLDKILPVFIKDFLTGSAMQRLQPTRLYSPAAAG